MLQHNRYFEDQVQSIGYERHGRKASVGVIAPGNFHFGTDGAERMSITSGEARVQRDGSDTFITYAAGSAFEVPAKSGFSISCSEACSYMCEYL